jgi:hypothetical protein
MRTVSERPAWGNIEEMSITYRWRGDFDNVEINRLHAEAFETRDLDSRDWQTALTEHSLGWATARDEGQLVGFVNVVWDGLVHAWIQDTMVTNVLRARGSTLILTIPLETSTSKPVAFRPRRLASSHWNDPARDRRDRVGCRVPSIGICADIWKPTTTSQRRRP